MKYTTILFAILLCIGGFCIGGLIGFWMMKTKSPPEVIKIYKTTPYESKQEKTEQHETATPPIENIRPSTREHAKSPQTEIVSESERLSASELLPELATLDTPSLSETITEGGEVVNDQDSDTDISYAELSKMVIETYDLKEVIKSYFDPTSGHCPNCGQQDFEIMRNAKNGRLEAWSCFNCYNGVYDVIEFVAWIEGIDKTEAVQQLATQAGILE